MKVLIIMGGFFPGQKFGGPPVSVDNFCSLLKDDCDCFIVTSNHDMDNNNVYPNFPHNLHIRYGMYGCFRLPQLSLQSLSTSAPLDYPTIHQPLPVYYIRVR